MANMYPTVTISVQGNPDPKVVATKFVMTALLPLDEFTRQAVLNEVLRLNSFAIHKKLNKIPPTEKFVVTHGVGVAV